MAKADVLLLWLSHQGTKQIYTLTGTNSTIVAIQKRPHVIN
jgi:hypothetical protein